MLYDGSLPSAQTCPPTLCKRDLVPSATLILIILLCYIYIASLINRIQPDDGHSSIGRNISLIS